MCKLKVNEIIVIRFETWGLKANTKYIVKDVKKDSRGNMCYYFKYHRKNAANVIKCYADEIDKEISNITYKELKEQPLKIIFNHYSIFKME